MAEISKRDSEELNAARQLVGDVPILAALEEWAKARQICGGQLIPAAEAWAARQGSSIEIIPVRDAVGSLCCRREQRNNYPQSRSPLGCADPDRCRQARAGRAGGTVPAILRPREVEKHHDAALGFPQGGTGVTGNWTRIWDPSREPIYAFLEGSGGLYSTTSDYARFRRAWMGPRTGRRAPVAVARRSWFRVFLRRVT